MLTFEMKISDRKKLIRKLSQMTGLEAVYQNPPTFAFRIGDYSVGRDGTLSVEESRADVMLLMRLMGEGFLVEKAIGTDAGELTPVRVDISLPLQDHSGRSLRNLINLVHSRASLINKATGSDFFVAGELTDVLADDGNICAVDVLKKVVRDFEAAHRGSLRGLEFGADSIALTGFPDYADSLTLKAWMDLAALMNRQALQQTRIMAKDVNEENERYSFRIWLIRLGMKGDEYKRTRRILLKNLSGHSAFRTQEEKERAKMKALQKRQAIREARVHGKGSTDFAVSTECGTAQGDHEDRGGSEGEAEAQSRGILPCVDIP